MLALSDILLSHHELKSFDELVELVRKKAREGETFLQFDIRPPYEDTPQNWEDTLEAAFTSVENSRPDMHRTQ